MRYAEAVKSFGKAGNEYVAPCDLDPMALDLAGIERQPRASVQRPWKGSGGAR